MFDITSKFPTKEDCFNGDSAVWIFKGISLYLWFETKHYLRMWISFFTVIKVPFCLLCGVDNMIMFFRML